MPEPQNGQTGDSGAAAAVGAGSAPAGGDANAASQPGSEGGNADDKGKGGGNATASMPDNLEDALKMIQVMSDTDDEKSEKLTTATTDLDDLKTKIGKQGDHVAALKKYESAVKDDPKSVIAEIASGAGLKVNFGEAPPKLDMAAALQSNDPEELKAAITALNQQSTIDAVAQVKKELGPAMDTLFENQMLQKYPDYNDLKTDRSLIQTKALAEELPWTEVFHMAAQGANLASAVTEADKQAYDRGVKETLAKLGASLPDGGAQPPDKGEKKPHDENDPEYLAAAIHHMTKMT